MQNKRQLILAMASHLYSAKLYCLLHAGASMAEGFIEADRILFAAAIWGCCMGSSGFQWSSKVGDGPVQGAARQDLSAYVRHWRCGAHSSSQKWPAPAHTGALPERTRLSGYAKLPDCSDSPLPDHQQSTFRRIDFNKPFHQSAGKHGNEDFIRHFNMGCFVKTIQETCGTSQSGVAYKIGTALEVICERLRPQGD